MIYDNIYIYMYTHEKYVLYIEHALQAIRVYIYIHIIYCFLKIILPSAPAAPTAPVAARGRSLIKQVTPSPWIGGP